MAASYIAEGGLWMSPQSRSILYWWQCDWMCIRNIHAGQKYIGEYPHQDVRCHVFPPLVVDDALSRVFERSGACRGGVG